jgi:hypothetical protein
VTTWLIDKFRRDGSHLNEGSAPPVRVTGGALACLVRY